MRNTFYGDLVLYGNDLTVNLLGPAVHMSMVVTYLIPAALDGCYQVTHDVPIDFTENHVSNFNIRYVGRERHQLSTFDSWSHTIADWSESNRNARLELFDFALSIHTHHYKRYIDFYKKKSKMDL